MGKAKKIVLFLVEGITDKVSLEGILPSFVENEEIMFQITYGDILTEENTNPQNIIKKVYTHIDKHLSNMRFHKSDIAQVVHLVDTDGAFVRDEKIVFADVNHIQYYSDRIETKDVAFIQKRNQIKSLALKRLVATPQIASIKYSVYYFLSNLEHVLHDIQKDPTKEEKMTLAENFSDKYSDSPKDFFAFVNSSEFAALGNFKFSWDFISENCNSLNRYCNFHLFF